MDLECGSQDNLFIEENASTWAFSQRFSKKLHLFVIVSESSFSGAKVVSEDLLPQFREGHFLLEMR